MCICVKKKWQPFWGPKFKLFHVFLPDNNDPCHGMFLGLSDLLRYLIFKQHDKLQKSRTSPIGTPQNHGYPCTSDKWWHRQKLDPMDVHIQNPKTWQNPFTQRNYPMVIFEQHYWWYIPKWVTVKDIYNARQAYNFEKSWLVPDWSKYSYLWPIKPIIQKSFGFKQYST